ncbi:hypothetical protein KNE206_53640 [Kitasatospora sp. NE20-6]|uniref:hypothetical protein n=1 Tax=Kitasatospora sp. NE20-6 TaxID=2859066 RepID=UPI0034DCB4FF
MLTATSSCPDRQCGCRQGFVLDLVHDDGRPQWQLTGLAGGRPWRAWFDQAIPVHLIAAACHPAATG